MMIGARQKLDSESHASLCWLHDATCIIMHPTCCLEGKAQGRENHKMFSLQNTHRNLFRKSTLIFHFSQRTGKKIVLKVVQNILAQNTVYKLR